MPRRKQEQFNLMELDFEAYKKFLREKSGAESLEAFYFVCDFSRQVKEAGGKALVVGGTVRDEVMGLTSKDYDIEVYGLQARLVDEIAHKMAPDYGKISEVGAAFGIIKFRISGVDVDISLPRRESKIGKTHKDFAVDTDPSMSVKEAASRRDFTINSLAKDMLTGEIYDYFGGIDDIKNKILKVTDEEKFKDDPLRVLRAVQFIGRFGLNVDEKSAEIIRQMRSELKYLPKERLKEEWLKLFLRSKKPSIGLEAAMEFGVFHELHKKEVIPLVSTKQEEEWHPEGDVWTHTLMVVDEAAKIVEMEKLDEKDALIIMLSSFCHDFGKPLTTEVIKGKIRALRHEEAGVKPAKKFLSDMGMETSLINPVLKIVAQHLKPSELYKNEVEKKEKVTDGAIMKLAARIHPATLKQLVLMAKADHLGRGPFVNKDGKKFMPREFPAEEWLMDRAQKLEVSQAAPKPAIMGRDLIELGFNPDRLFGQIIKAADLLRDDADMARDDILSLISENKDKSLSKIVEKMKERLEL